MSFSTDLARLSKFSSRLFKNWGPTMGVYGGIATVGLLYMTDWQVTNKSIPFYGRKFDDDGNL